MNSETQPDLQGYRFLKHSCLEHQELSISLVVPSAPPWEQSSIYAEDDLGDVDLGLLLSMADGKSSGEDF